MNKKQAFTLIELMVAMGVIAVISALSIFGVQQILTAQTNTQKRKVLEQLDLELSSYLNNFNRLPNTVTFTTGGTVVLNDPTRTPSTIATEIKVTGTDADFCYQVNPSNPQLYTTAVTLSSKTECKGTFSGATTCTSGGTTFNCE